MTLLLEPTDLELADAVQQNLFDLFRSMARLLPNGECEEGVTLCRHFSFPTNPMFKGVWGTRLGADEVERTIDTTIAWFSERKAPYFFCWTGPGTEPAKLGERLMARGLLDMAEQQTALAAGVRQTTLGAPSMALATRHLGIGGAITLGPLLEARRDGYRHAVLFSTELGVGAYQRIGFRVVPGRINRYLWRAR